MSEKTTDPVLREIESALRQLGPQPGRLDRDALMFRAGQASLAGRNRARRLREVALAIVVLALSTFIVLRPEPPVVERLVHVPMTTSVPSAQLTTQPPVKNSSNAPAVFQDDAGSVGESYLRLRHQAVRWGLDAVPRPGARDRMAPTAPLPPVELSPGSLYCRHFSELDTF